MKQFFGSRTVVFLALVALLFSVGGVTYAAGKINGANIAKRSIPAKAIQKGAITKKEIKKDTITSKQIKEQTLPFAPKQVEAVHVVGASGEVPFGSGWAFDGDVSEEVPGFWKDQGGTVHLRGAISRISGVAITMFTLPPGYRPAKEQYFITYGASGTPAYVYVTSAGKVEYFSGPDGYIGLGNVAFRADQ